MIVPPGSGRSVTALGSTYRSLADGAATRGAYTLVEEEFWAATTPLHAHVGAEEAFWVLAGEVAVWLDGEETAAGPGSFLLVPRGVPHALRRLGADPVRMLTLLSPPGVEVLFDEVVRLGEDALLADPERLAALAAEHGTTVLGDHPLDDG